MKQPGAVAMMGGCNVLTRWRRRRLDAPVVVGLRRLPGIPRPPLRRRASEDRRGRVPGAATSAPELARDWPVIANALDIIGSPAIRSAATAVGNVAEARPVSDLVPLVQVHDAELHIAGPASERRLPVVDYATTPRTGAIEPGELVTARGIPIPAPGFRAVYERFSAGPRLTCPSFRSPSVRA